MNKKRRRKVEAKIEFVLNGRRVIHVILYIIQQSGGEINKYKFMKIIFEADRYHLNKYGRVVTGDLYKKKAFGPAPAAILDTLTGRRKLTRYLRAMGMKELPYKYNKEREVVYSSVPPNDRFFPKYAVEAIEHGIEKCRGLSVSEIKQESYKEVSWQDTDSDDYIPFELIIENKEVLEQLSEHPYGIVV